jgi:hypothetical protein
VAQQFPTTAQVIYDVLSSDPEFSAALGTYTFRAGQSLPAISLVSPGTDLPAVRKVRGLECIVQDAGDLTNSYYLTGDAPRTKVTWSVFLVSWKPSTGADMQVAAERACRIFMGSEAVQTVAVADGLGAQVQTKVIIRSDMPILGT